MQLFKKIIWGVVIVCAIFFFTVPVIFAEDTVVPITPDTSIVTPACTAGEGGYCLLAPLPGLSSINADTSFGEYLNFIIKFTIGFSAVIAVVLIVLGGIEYMGSDAFTTKEEAKGKITRAITGLLLALGGFLLLNTINPNLVNLKLNIVNQKITVEEITDSGEIIQIQYPGNVGECPASCVKLKGVGGIDVPYESKGDSVVSPLKGSLQSLVSSMNANAISWTVTEAWAPSREHKAHCHKIGTCIDANFRGLADNSNPPPDKVKAFINSATTLGLCPIYEVKTNEQLNTMINAGISSNNVKNLGSWISAPHFSVYGGTCKK